ncbi:uncharacterized protein LOC121367049 [Gigantopelta aegis]|uniref:uncharacterized protein LOC121367049 n=1 Tax=Gigantopelta aegis TaxID=1735272 RepID=UPI001B8899A2|nr:uncharacterized protein LOC121367049 [Gigantopelta aegis]
MSRMCRAAVWVFVSLCVLILIKRYQVCANHAEADDESIILNSSPETILTKRSTDFDVGNQKTKRSLENFKLSRAKYNLKNRLPEQTIRKRSKDIHRGNRTIGHLNILSHAKSRSSDLNRVNKKIGLECHLGIPSRDNSRSTDLNRVNKKIGLERHLNIFSHAKSRSTDLNRVNKKIGLERHLDILSPAKSRSIDLNRVNKPIKRFLSVLSHAKGRGMYHLGQITAEGNDKPDLLMSSQKQTSTKRSTALNVTRLNIRNVILTIQNDAKRSGVPVLDSTESQTIRNGDGRPNLQRSAPEHSPNKRYDPVTNIVNEKKLHILSDAKGNGMFVVDFRVSVVKPSLKIYTPVQRTP